MLTSQRQVLTMAGGIMKTEPGIRRKAHFVGAKIKSLRKRNNLTLEDLSVRCIQLDADAAPSVSYLSMIENGRRTPSEGLLQADRGHLSEGPGRGFSMRPSRRKPSIRRRRKPRCMDLPFEPAFLFSEGLLQMAIPELLSQTGTTGRQFAHLLIRTHQEARRNRFPDLERAAESIGKKMFPLDVDHVLQLAK